MISRSIQSATGIPDEWLGRMVRCARKQESDRVAFWTGGAPARRSSDPRSPLLSMAEVLSASESLVLTQTLTVECLDLSGPRRPDHSVGKRHCGGTETGDRHITGIGSLFVRSSGAEADEEGLLAAK